MHPEAKAINSGPMAICDTSAIAAWLTDGARSATRPQLILAELCERLVACDIPLWRVAVFVRTLHPQIMGYRPAAFRRLISKTILPSKWRILLDFAV
jgi:adenylate cyclase